MSNDNIREIGEILGVFDPVEAFEGASGDPLSSGFDKSGIGLLPAEQTVDKTGAVATVGADVASGGGPGDRHGAGCSDARRKMPNRRRSHEGQEQLERGGMVPWLRAFHTDRVERAVALRHSGRDAHVSAAAQAQPRGGTIPLKSRILAFARRQYMCGA